MEDGQDSDGVVSVTDSEDEEQKAKEKFRAFVKQKGVLTLQYFPDEMEFHFRPKSQENGVQISILSNFHFIENETAKFRFPFSANVPISFKMQHPGTRKQCWRVSTAHPTFLSYKTYFQNKMNFENIFVFMFCFNHTTQRAVYRLRQTQQDKRRRCSGGECVPGI